MGIFSHHITQLVFLGFLFWLLIMLFASHRKNSPHVALKTLVPSAFSLLALWSICCTSMFWGFIMLSSVSYSSSLGRLGYNDSTLSSVSVATSSDTISSPTVSLFTPLKKCLLGSSFLETLAFYYGSLSYCCHHFGSKCLTHKTAFRPVSIKVQLFTINVKHEHDLVNYQCQTRAQSLQLLMSTQT